MNLEDDKVPHLHWWEHSISHRINNTKNILYHKISKALYKQNFPSYLCPPTGIRQEEPYMDLQGNIPRHTHNLPPWEAKSSTIGRRHHHIWWWEHLHVEPWDLPTSSFMDPVERVYPTPTVDVGHGPSLERRIPKWTHIQIVLTHHFYTW